jgi:hypothetical protein
VLSATVIARAPRVFHLLLGEHAMVAELAIEPSADEHELRGAMGSRTKRQTPRCAGTLPAG